MVENEKLVSPLEVTDFSNEIGHRNLKEVNNFQYFYYGVARETHFQISSIRVCLGKSSPSQLLTVFQCNRSSELMKLIALNVSLFSRYNSL